ncbi:MAG: glycosyltransferase family 4 protein [Anaerolineae bacterium]
MKILFCNYEYPPLGGGGGVVNALLAEEMAKHHDVTVLTSQGLGLPRERMENGVRVIRVPVFFRQEEAVANLRSMATFIPMAIKEGLKLLRHERFDVINTHFVLPTGPVGEVLSRYGRIPNVLSVHGGDLYDPSKTLSPHRHPILRTVIRRLLRKADAVIGQSRNTLHNMNHIYTPELEGHRIPLAIKRRYRWPVGKPQSC